MDSVLLVLFLLYAVGYWIIFLRDKWDMFYIRKKEMKSTPEREYLRNEILELQKELDLMRVKDNPDVSVIKEIEKEMECKKNRLSFIINWE